MICKKMLTIYNLYKYIKIYERNSIYLCNSNNKIVVLKLSNWVQTLFQQKYFLGNLSLK